MHVRFDFLLIRQVMRLAGPLVLSMTGYMLMQFIDAFNITLLGALMAAGDTRWTSVATGLLYVVFVGGLVVADTLRLGLYAEWTWATVFVLVIASVWIWRFRAGVWKTIRVIEADGSPTELP